MHVIVRGGVVAVSAPNGELKLYEDNSELERFLLERKDVALQHTLDSMML